MVTGFHENYETRLTSENIDFHRNYTGKLSSSPSQSPQWYVAGSTRVKEGRASNRRGCRSKRQCSYKW